MKSRSILPIIAFIGLPSAALAQGHADQDSGLQVTISGGIVSAPSFVGDDDYQTSIFPNVTLRYGDRLEASLRGIEYTAIIGDGWKAGGILGYDFGREEAPDASDFMISGEASTDLIGLGDVDGTIEIGGFVAYEAGPFAAHFELRQGVDGGHDGLHGEARAQYRGRFDAMALPVFFGVGPKISFGDDAYNSAYFDVSAAQSAASGISEYDAGGGINSYGLGANVMVPLSAQTSLIGFVDYEQLTGDVGNSSIVQERGSQDQVRAGVFLNYTF
ncbi:outer membrane scaffolding protein for murein synthesis (MipA/OmpV family) [Pacificibacter maritimus]|uniref:Outer membrane scaffolding protein for murein synthesis (MipA/OmpV family) n=1 Tax=Pacificibacter maritimus TaxID=762213 RepID=A0A3N4ULQ9_9RHOB|nr:MipA/OmpV family protein [Pacificibacter maritimus]RPE70948.1 outer membrane scaffolding protein for murein synthesis (MipA/OmpV family) [Pacificibacter maritimus]